MKDLIYRHELRKELSKVHAEMGLCSKKEIMDIIGRQRRHPISKTHIFAYKEDNNEQSRRNIQTYVS